MSTYFKKMQFLWLDLDTSPAAICSILSGAFWATCLALPGDTLLRPTYKYMAQIASEEVWMCSFAALAGLQLWRLGSRPLKVPYLDFAIKFWALSLWAFVSIACLASQWPIAAAMSDTLVIAIACAWDFLRCDPRHGCVHYAKRKCPDCTATCGVRDA
jgi:hypothetical protein